MDLRPIVERIVDREGGVSADADDRGGVTNWGITVPWLSDVSGHPVTVEDVRTLTRTEAVQWYLSWATMCRFDTLGDALWQNDKVMDCILDWAVNAGARSAITMVQGLIGVKQDGLIGPDTLAAAHKRPPAIKDLVAHRLMARANQCVMQPSQVKFLNGWIRRDVSFL